MAARNTSARAMLWCNKKFIFSLKVDQIKKDRSEKGMACSKFSLREILTHKSTADKRFCCLKKQNKRKWLAFFITLWMISPDGSGKACGVAWGKFGHLKIWGKFGQSMELI